MNTSRKTFLKNFEAQFEDRAPGTINSSTRFRDIEEWSSLRALFIIGMIDSEYGVEFTAEDFRKINTVAEMHQIVKSRVRK